MTERALACATQATRDHGDRVRTLFDAKAAGWPGKYAPDGPLAARLNQFAAALRDVTGPGAELLDLGCGSGELARHLAVAGYGVTGCDISARMLDQAAAADAGTAVRWTRLKPGWRVLPFAAGSLDAVIAASVLEYVQHPAEVLAECARVLRPGGVMLCTVPAMAHPVRWLEWPFWLAARAPLPDVGRIAGVRAAHYVAYLRASRQRHLLRWWRAVGRKAGLESGSVRQAAREPLRLLMFTRLENTAGQSIDDDLEAQCRRQ